MHIAVIIVSFLLAAAMVMSGSLKFVRPERIVRLMAAVGFTGRALPVLGALQIAGAVGLVIGIWFLPIGIAAAICLVLYFAGAIIAHVRAHDPEWSGAATFLVLSLVTSVVLIVSA